MSEKLQPTFVVAISSRALFDLEDGHAIYVKDGVLAFDEYMRAHEQKPLRPGVAFSLIKKLLSLNAPGKSDKVSVVLLSSNTLEAGARVMNSALHYGLTINRAFFTAGGDRVAIAKACKAHLFLSTNPDEVRSALNSGLASAQLIPTTNVGAGEEREGLCVAFDGDAVLFSDEAEQVYQSHGLAAFQASEASKAKVPLAAGPFKPVLAALQQLRQQLEEEKHPMRLRLALVTARAPVAYARVLHTFRTWGGNVNEAFFLDGAEKGPFLGTLGADLFVDDGIHHVHSAAAHYIPAAHVPWGCVGSRPQAAG